MKLSLVPALKDNYIWILSNQQKALVVDPTLAEPVIDFLQKHNLTLTNILITHHHWDHIGGLDELYQHYKPQVYAPNHVDIKVPFVNANELTEISLDQLSIKVLQTPGHTLTHCCYFIEQTIDLPPLLFSGDTLFAAGCGRVFEGSMQQMFDSLQRLKQLPAQTLICCGHDYIISNLTFAKSVEPDNELIKSCLQKYSQQQRQATDYLPINLAQDLLINPFLKTDNISIKQSIELKTSSEILDEVELFSSLRELKNSF